MKNVMHVIGSMVKCIVVVLLFSIQLIFTLFVVTMRLVLSMIKIAEG